MILRAPDSHRDPRNLRVNLRFAFKKHHPGAIKKLFSARLRGTSALICGLHSKIIIQAPSKNYSPRASAKPPR